MSRRKDNNTNDDWLEIRREHQSKQNLLLKKLQLENALAQVELRKRQNDTSYEMLSNRLKIIERLNANGALVSRLKLAKRLRGDNF